jgi:FkbM family methyltransferase
VEFKLFGKIRSSGINFIPVQIKYFIIKNFLTNSIKPYIIKKNIDGVLFDFLIGDATGEEWYNGSWSVLSPQWEFNKNLIQKGDIIFDVGAHHGFYTILMALWTGSEGKVIAFEPSVHNFKILQKNIEMNNLKNVILINKAVGSSDEKVSISDDRNATVIKKRTFLQEVEMTFLDQFLNYTPNFIKIDVEGYETEVLKGAEKILKNKPRIDLELHVNELKHLGFQIEDIFKSLNMNDYTLWIQESGDSIPKLFENEPIIAHQQVHLFAIPK